MPTTTPSIPTCSQCGSPLVFISRKTEMTENSKFPTTTTIYRCSNQECQDEKDRVEVRRIKLKEEQDVAKKKREEERSAKKKQFMDTSS